eukprot:MONOS_8560.1-p1 / transcript=MONOS_8560.1 / gene=MONOS_8560 / organism=Monocercomonoides_exilis_PA203 / gene_product=unspecified product / transcript_product=unspecified product / location=Mono_scaffold00326:908-9898(-) / protein_length=2997 / sequence_SO=supercontig / SO=protein_coding / is_pseudo=false
MLSSSIISCNFYNMTSISSGAEDDYLPSRCCSNLFDSSSFHKVQNPYYGFFVDNRGLDHFNVFNSSFDECLNYRYSFFNYRQEFNQGTHSFEEAQFMNIRTTDSLEGGALEICNEASVTILYGSFIWCSVDTVVTESHAGIGGGFVAKDTSHPIVLKGVQFENCSAFSAGGAIGFYRTTGLASVSQCVFEKCISGKILTPPSRTTNLHEHYQNPKKFTEANEDLDFCRESGGAIYICMAKEASISGCSFEECGSVHGGGAIGIDSFNYPNPDASFDFTATFSDCVFQECFASPTSDQEQRSGGGAMWIYDISQDSFLSVMFCSFLKNYLKANALENGGNNKESESNSETEGTDIVFSKSCTRIPPLEQFGWSTSTSNQVRVFDASKKLALNEFLPNPLNSKIIVKNGGSISSVCGEDEQNPCSTIESGIKRVYVISPQVLDIREGVYAETKTLNLNKHSCQNHYDSSKFHLKGESLNKVTIHPTIVKANANEEQVMTEDAEPGNGWIKCSGCNLLMEELKIKPNCVSGYIHTILYLTQQEACASFVHCEFNGEAPVQKHNDLTNAMKNGKSNEDMLSSSVIVAENGFVSLTNVAFNSLTLLNVPCINLITPYKMLAKKVTFSAVTRKEDIPSQNMGGAAFSCKLISSNTLDFEECSFENVKITTPTNARKSINGKTELGTMSNEDILLSNCGAAFYFSMEDYSQFTITDTKFNACTAKGTYAGRGGAIFIRKKGSTSQFKLNNCNFINCDANVGRDVFVNVDSASQSLVEAAPLSSFNFVKIAPYDKANALFGRNSDTDLDLTKVWKRSAEIAFTSEKGEDVSFCGSEVEPCRGLVNAARNLAGDTKTLYVCDKSDISGEIKLDGVSIQKMGSTQPKITVSWNEQDEVTIPSLIQTETTLSISQMEFYLPTSVGHQSLIRSSGTLISIGYVSFQPILQANFWAHDGLSSNQIGTSANEDDFHVDFAILAASSGDVNINSVALNLMSSTSVVLNFESNTNKVELTDLIARKLKLSLNFLKCESKELILHSLDMNDISVSKVQAKNDDTGSHSVLDLSVPTDGIANINNTLSSEIHNTETGKVTGGLIKATIQSGGSLNLKGGSYKACSVNENEGRGGALYFAVKNSEGSQFLLDGITFLNNKARFGSDMFLFAQKDLSNSAKESRFCFPFDSDHFLHQNSLSGCEANNEGKVVSLFSFWEYFGSNVYVDGREPHINEKLCGSSNRPCLTVEYGLTHLYNSESDDSVLKLTIVSSAEVKTEINLSDVTVMGGSSDPLEKLIIKLEAQELASKGLILIEGDSGISNIEIDLLEKLAENNLKYSMIYSEAGSAKFINCIFNGAQSNLYGSSHQNYQSLQNTVIDIKYPVMHINSGDVEIKACTFTSFTTNQPLIWAEKASLLGITSTKIVNINYLYDTSSISPSLISCAMTTHFEISESNCSDVIITSSKIPAPFIGTNIEPNCIWKISNCNFTRISSNTVAGTNGGCLFLSIDGDGRFSVASTTFAQCTVNNKQASGSVGGRGGAVYIHFLASSLYNYLLSAITFTQNDAYHGRDAYLLNDNALELCAKNEYFAFDISEKMYNRNNALWGSGKGSYSNEKDLIELWEYRSNKLFVATKGEDTLLCGSNDNPCLSLDYVMSHFPSDATTRTISIKGTGHLYEDADFSGLLINSESYTSSIVIAEESHELTETDPLIRISTTEAKKDFTETTIKSCSFVVPAKCKHTYLIGIYGGSTKLISVSAVQNKMEEFNYCRWTFATIEGGSVEISDSTFCGLNITRPIFKVGKASVVFNSTNVGSIEMMTNGDLSEDIAVSAFSLNIPANYKTIFKNLTICEIGGTFVEKGKGMGINAKVEEDGGEIIIEKSELTFCLADMYAGKGGALFIDISNVKPKSTSLSGDILGSLDNAEYLFYLDSVYFEMNSAHIGGDVYVYADSIKKQVLKMQFHLSDEAFNISWNGFWAKDCSDYTDDINLLEIWYYHNEKIYASQKGKDTDRCGEENNPCQTVYFGVRHLLIYKEDKEMHLIIMEQSSLSSSLSIVKCSLHSSKPTSLAGITINATTEEPKDALIVGVNSFTVKDIHFNVTTQMDYRYFILSSVIEGEYGLTLNHVRLSASSSVAINFIFAGVLNGFLKVDKLSVESTRHGSPIIKLDYINVTSQINNITASSVNLTSCSLIESARTKRLLITNYTINKVVSTSTTGCALKAAATTGMHVSLTKCYFTSADTNSNNGEGGACHIRMEEDAMVTISDSIFTTCSANSKSGRGGALFMFLSDGCSLEYQLNEIKFDQCKAAFGSDIYFYSIGPSLKEISAPSKFNFSLNPLVFKRTNAIFGRDTETIDKDIMQFWEYNNETVYISKAGDDFVTCGTQLNPCKSINYCRNRLTGGKQQALILNNLLISEKSQITGIEMYNGKLETVPQVTVRMDSDSGDYILENEGNTLLSTLNIIIEDPKNFEVFLHSTIGLSRITSSELIGKISNSFALALICVEGGSFEFNDVIIKNFSFADNVPSTNINSHETIFRNDMISNDSDETLLHNTQMNALSFKGAIIFRGITKANLLNITCSNITMASKSFIEVEPKTVPQEVMPVEAGEKTITISNSIFHDISSQSISDPALIYSEDKDISYSFSDARIIRCLSKSSSASSAYFKNSVLNWKFCIVKGQLYTDSDSHTSHNFEKDIGLLSANETESNHIRDTKKSSNDEVEVCSWKHSMMEFEACTTTMEDPTVANSTCGGLSVIGGKLVITTGEFFNNNPVINRFPSARHNIHCEQKGNVEVKSVKGSSDGAPENPSMWVDRQDCQVAGVQTLSKAPLFVPILKNITVVKQSSTIQSNDAEGPLVIFNGENLMPCLMIGEMFFIVHGVEISSMTFPLVSFSNDTSCAGIPKQSYIDTADRKTVIAVRIQFGGLAGAEDKKEITNYSIFRDMLPDEVDKKAEQMPPTVTGFMVAFVMMFAACVTLCVIIVYVVYTRKRRRKRRLQHTEDSLRKQLILSDDEQAALES